MSSFTPFRALGYVSDAVPPAFQKRGGQASFMTTAAGEVWQLYECAHARLVLVGPPLGGAIRALAVSKDVTAAAVDEKIHLCRRAHHFATLEGHTSPIVQLLALGPVLLSLGRDRRLLVWNLGKIENAKGDRGESEPEPEVEVVVGGSRSSAGMGGKFSPTCMVHPDTYLNKVLIGSEEGAIELWNFSTQQLLYTFKGWGVPVRVLSNSPALDVVGVGLASGAAVMINLRYDKEIFSLGEAAEAAGAAALTAGKREITQVTSMAFSTSLGKPLLAIGGQRGVITVWNLEKRRVETIMKDSHDGAVASLHFFPGEPVLVSVGVDNAFKFWIFDNADGTARLLRFRAGHSAPPTVVKYYDNGRSLLSAGNDRSFRMFSAIQDQQSRELSQGHIARRAKRLKVSDSELKLPPLTGVATCELRSRDWCDVLTCHVGCSTAYSWRVKNSTIGEHSLQPPAVMGRRASPVTAVALSVCGNFGVIGTENGKVHRFNMQSGLYRGEYVLGEDGTCHNAAILCIGSDGSNRRMVSVGQDGQLIVWDFKKRKYISTIQMDVYVLKASYHQLSSLLAIGHVDNVVSVVDISSGNILRKFVGHKDRITAMEWSSDAKWLLTASVDGALRLWDVPATRCVQEMFTSPAITSLSLSPKLDVLATTQVGRNGIYTWMNMIMYGGIVEADLNRKAKAITIPLPAIRVGDEEDEQLLMDGEESCEDYSIDETSGGDDDIIVTPKIGKSHGPDGPHPVGPQLLTLSMLPSEQIQSMLKLDLVRARNKPIEAPKKPADAPFFLPTLATLDGNPAFDVNGVDEDDGEGDENKSGHIRTGATGEDSQLLKVIKKGAKKRNYTDAIAYIRDTKSSILDGDIRELGFGLEEEEANSQIMSILIFLKSALQEGSNIDLLHTFLAMLLQSHGETISGDEGLRDVASDISDQVQKVWSRASSIFQDVRCMLEIIQGLYQ